MKKPTGYPAFPYEHTYQVHMGKSKEIEDVLTTRDYIAIKCLPFFLDKMSGLGYGIVAEHAYLMADRLIEKRERK